MFMLNNKKTTTTKISQKSRDRQTMRQTDRDTDRQRHRQGQRKRENPLMPVTVEFVIPWQNDRTGQ